MKDNIYTIAYAVAMGAVCALLLTSASMLAAPYKEKNRQAAQRANVLSVLQVPVPADASSDTINDLYEKNVRPGSYGDLKTYEYINDKQEVQAIALPFSGMGLWGPIKGFIAFEPDMKTIRSISFYEQEETPGLGGEIATSDFQDEFAGKVAISSEGRPAIKIARGKSTAPNEVDGITGATMTGDKVQIMLDNIVSQIIKEQKNNVR